MKFPRFALIAVATLSVAISVRAQAPTPRPVLEWVDGAKQHPDYRFKITTDREVPIYRVGETVTFTLTATHKGQPIDGKEIKWSITKDGLLPALQEGKLTLKEGKAVFSGKLDEPGFLQCRVDFQSPGESVPGAKAAAAFDPLEIKASLPVPEDFDAFWEAEKKLVKDTPANVKMTPVKSQVAGVECFDVQAEIPGGKPFSAYLARPSGAKPGTLPAIVCTQGAGVAGSRLSIVAGWAKDGLIAIDFNAHGLPNGQPQKFYSDLYKGELKEYYLKNADSRETIFFRVLFQRLLRALEIIEAQPEWDGKRLIVHGRSQGGGQAIAAAGLEPRVTLTCAQIPALCDQSGPMANRIGGWPLHLTVKDKEGKAPDPKVVEAWRYYDMINFATRGKGEAFFTVGFIDISCPPSGVYATYNQWPGKKDILNFYRYGHIASPEGDAAVREKVLAHIGKTPKEIAAAMAKDNKAQPGEE